MQIRSSRKRPLPVWHWAIPLALLAGVALLIVLAPEERTLGGGIRSVYLHVGLIWAGLLGFGLTAVLGLGVLLNAKKSWVEWLKLLGWVSLGLYAAGVFMSMVASADNWGSVFFQEPRMAASLNGLALATIALVFGSWAPWPRLLGALSLSIPTIILWLNAQADLVLHPPNPIATSNSTPIQLTFFLATGLFLLLGGWLVWLLRGRQQQ